jgi:hypothetical protein
MTFPPKEPQHSHKQDPQKTTWIRKEDQYSNEDGNSLYKLNIRNVVGILTMDVQNT